MNDLELLQQYEPVIKFTEGEMFFPCAVDEYVRRSSLWMRPPDKGSRVQIPAGALDLQKLVTYSLHNPIPPDHDLFLRFVQNPLNSIEYRRWQLRKDRPKFKAPGRLARVGLAGRLA
ncbi:MAG TPA: hypothetical protein VJZ27_05960, partial [Aggregatilineales bacterium]|nr:hypothetical protein [Aggregatilineales bacterium]